MILNVLFFFHDVRCQDMMFLTSQQDVLEFISRIVSGAVMLVLLFGCAEGPT